MDNKKINEKEILKELNNRLEEKVIIFRKMEVATDIKDDYNKKGFFLIETASRKGFRYELSKSWWNNFNNADCFDVEIPKIFFQEYLNFHPTFSEEGISNKELLDILKEKIKSNKIVVKEDKGEFYLLNSELVDNQIPLKDSKI